MKQASGDRTVPDGMALVEANVLTETPGRLVDEVLATLTDAGVPHRLHGHGPTLDTRPVRLD